MLAACAPRPSASAKTEISLATWGSSAEIAVLKQQLADFERAHPAVRVRLMHIPDNYYQKLHLLIAGNLAPDVMLTNSINFPVYASHGVFADLTGRVDTGAYYPEALAAFAWRDPGKPKPALGAIPRDISNLLVYYNRDCFRRAGLPDPSPGWDWKAFARTARALSVDADGDGRPERFGVSFYTQPPLFWLPWVWSAGGDLFDDTMSAVTLDTPEALEGLSFYRALRWPAARTQGGSAASAQRGSDDNTLHVAPRQVESGGNTMTQWFLQQKLAMVVSGRWSVPVFRQEATFDWDVVPLPRGPSGLSRVGIDASGYAVSAASAHPDQALALVRFLTSRPAIETITRSGLIVPARKDVAESPVFLSPGERPAHGRYFLSVIPGGVPTRTPQRWNEISEALMLALQPVWDGQAELAPALARVTPRLNAMLQTERRSDRADRQHRQHPERQP